jgi:predicted nuclease of predicted toxin-antitoxin system
MIIADENIDAAFILALRKIPIKVISIREDFSGITDEAIIKLAKKSECILLTEDKDFGEWVFAHNVKGISVVFLRYSVKQKEKMISILLNLMKEKRTHLHNKFTTITINKIRMRAI